MNLEMPDQDGSARRTLVDLLQQQSARYRDKVAFGFSCDGDEHHTGQLTFRELDAAARRIASGLSRQGAAGNRVLLLCPPGLDFIAGMFGCLYAGAIAVPVHPPMREHLVPRVASIVADLQPDFALTTAAVHARIGATVDDLAGGRPLRWCVLDAADGDERTWVRPDVDADTVAMVQYTSGSTSAPKGVVLSHGNLMHNLETIRQAWNGDDDAVGVFWLPPFHDMGLIGSIFESLYVAATSYLMPPTAFIKRPMRWLEAISRHRGTITAAPNFAYDMCVELSSPEQRAALDLSSLSTAMCGAEPVQTATLRSFADAFAPAGFRPQAFHPVYGLAEATLLVSGGSDLPTPRVEHLDRAALRDNRVLQADADVADAATLVGCGKPRGGQQVIIVDPETRRECPADRIGEIWVSGPSAARGYWGSPEQSAETFAATTDTGAGPFLRTGDLGFVRSGELFVTGRCKDLIIIRGSNHYPNDIELTVQDCHPALLRGRGAVFATTPESGGAERLTVVQEIDTGRVGAAELAEITQAIRAAVTARHEIRPDAVLLTEPLRLPTTSSGKIQRSACRQQFSDGELAVVTAWQASAPPPPPAAPGPPAAADRPSAAQIADWLTAHLAGALAVPTAEIDSSRPFAYYGLDSVHAVRLTTALEAWLGGELSPTLAYDYPSIDALAAHLAQGHPPAENVSADKRVPDEPIAIVGIGCRFPCAHGPQEFWRLLSGGVDAVADIPADRWDVEAFYDPDPTAPGTAVTRKGGFLSGVDQFDHDFFGITPREAAHMDPQQRLLLETAWEALEDGGQVPRRLAGSRTGVFVGISTNDYGAPRMAQPQLVDAYTGTGNALSISANRVSYVFDLHGPSMAVDTACSSSLVAVDLACRSLRDGECTMALAAGVNVMLSPALMINFTKAQVMASDGRCKTFDADADGYVRGEGAGVVVLKPLSAALADNDRIYAVIRGTATNSDGRTNGLMAPSGRAQEAVLAEAYRRAGLSPGAVHYVEAHGTGTALGDAIEAKALGAVLADGRPPGSRCLIGSVKTNIGHLEAAAGIAGLIKTALALRHRHIPPSLNFTTPNPHIPFGALALDVAHTLTPWPDTGARAVAGVSAFGFGGTNAHAVLTEAPHVRDTAPDAATGRVELLPISARTPEALEALVGDYELALMTGTPLRDLCYTAGARRDHHEHRVCVVGESPAALFEALAGYRQDQPRPGLSRGRCQPGHAPSVIFVFSGQGSQWLGMGRRLQQEEPVFRDALAACDAALTPHLGALTAGHDGSGLTGIDRIQPAIFAIQVALAALWRSWGVQPATVIGHSMGEVAAAHVAGALSLDDAARVICARGALLHRMRGAGAMMVAEVSVADAQQLIAGREPQVAIAASNSCRSTVLSGDRAVLAELMTVLQQRDRFCRFIDVDAASHHPQLQALAGELRDRLAGLQPSAPRVPFYSAVTGDALGQRLLDADYWVANLCAPVRFSPAMRHLLNDGRDTFVEISPHPILVTAAREDAEELGRPATVLASMRRDDDGRATALASLAALYTRGLPVAWERLYPDGGRCIPAPTYRWQRSRSWLDAAPITAAADGSDAVVWRGPLRSAVHPGTVLAEVDLGTEPLAKPAEELLTELALTGAAKVFGPEPRALRELSVHRPLGPAPATVQLVWHDRRSFECYRAESDGSWTLLAGGRLDAGAARALPARLRDTLHQLRWQPTSIPADGDTPNHARTPGTWLLFSDGGSAADTLRDHLESQAQSCVVIEADVGLDRLQRLGPDTYRLNPTRPEHFHQLLTDAVGHDRAPCRGVVHLWSLLAAAPDTIDAAALEAATSLGSLSVLHLVQAVTTAGWPDPPRLWLVTRGAQHLDTDTAPVSVAQAPVWGLARSINHEHPELRCARVDLSVGGGPEELRALFCELRADGPETDVALRGYRRYVARLTRDDATPPSDRVEIRADGSYLITGGLGALGLQLAGWLVEHGARHLVLMGRSGASESAQATVQQLRAHGADVHLVRGDVTRAQDVAAALDRIAASMPPLRGVLHAAGTVDDALVAYLDERQLRGVLAPKVKGAWHLHALTRDAPLDFFVLFSSAASVLGSPGAANYGAANAFLDALAWQRRTEGKPALSVNWGPWAGLGFFTRSELHRHFDHYGVAAMAAEDCLRVLASLLTCRAAQVAVLDVDWARWCAGLGSGTPPLLSQVYAADGDAAAGGPGRGLAEALHGAPPEERQRLLESYLRELTAAKLGVAPSALDVAAPLGGLGVDSLITLELRIQIERDLGVVVPVARLLDGPSVASVSGWLAEQLASPAAASPKSTPARENASTSPASVDLGDVAGGEVAGGAHEIELLATVPELSDDAVDDLLRQVIAGNEGTP
ncbi:SDR family NAD(P)-dependent oxidoreductase [Mycobacterium sp. pUA109]|uniref:SDR family NAD(P)-dependent oxidoreductase n=1 Tax=Mycobacterium sp. pUA109 TaxID=3238982 RepID=UPI00351BDB8A